MDKVWEKTIYSSRRQKEPFETAFVVTMVRSVRHRRFSEGQSGRPGPQDVPP
jgi:hypothetical protein